MSEEKLSHQETAGPSIAENMSQELPSSPEEVVQLGLDPIPEHLQRIDIPDPILVKIISPTQLSHENHIFELNEVQVRIMNVLFENEYITLRTILNTCIQNPNIHWSFARHRIDSLRWGLAQHNGPQLIEKMKHQQSPFLYRLHSRLRFLETRANLITEENDPELAREERSMMTILPAAPFVEGDKSSPIRYEQPIIDAIQEEVITVAPLIDGDNEQSILKANQKEPASLKEGDDVASVLEASQTPVAVESLGVLAMAQPTTSLQLALTEDGNAAQYNVALPTDYTLAYPPIHRLEDLTQDELAEIAAIVQGQSLVDGKLKLGTEDWRDQALCAETDPDLFYPLKEENGIEGVEQAKRTCGRCAVRYECLEYALERNEKHGIWGGLLTAERQYLRNPTNSNE
jgi:hypothetical protein